MVFRVANHHAVAVEGGGGEEEAGDVFGHGIENKQSSWYIITDESAMRMRTIGKEPQILELFSSSIQIMVEVMGVEPMPAG